MITSTSGTQRQRSAAVDVGQVDSAPASLQQQLQGWLGLSAHHFLLHLHHTNNTDLGGQGVCGHHGAPVFAIITFSVKLLFGDFLFYHFFF